MTQTVDTAAPDVADVAIENTSIDPSVHEPDVTPDAAVARPRQPRRVHIQAPHLAVAAIVAFNLWFLRAQRMVLPYPNDSAFHAQMVTAATRMLSHGQNPFASWFPNLSFGSPLFVQYQGASAVVTGAIGLVVGSLQAYSWSLYLLFALWPLCVYWTGRLLGWNRWECAVAAVVAPLLFSIHGRGFELRAYVWSGAGLWAQLWAMWSLPLALGFGWRYISQRRYLFGAVAAFAATIAFHFLMAYLLAILLVVLVFLKPSDLLRRAGRAAIVGGCALAATLWVTLPLLAEARWTALDESQVGTPIDNSFGAPAILHRLVTGGVFDYSRAPVVTVLVAIGLFVCIGRFRRDERARVLVAVFGASLLLFFGRPTLGFLLDRLPASQNLLFQRFVVGVQLSGILLAGVGAVAATRALIAGAHWLAPHLAETLRGDRRWRVVGLAVVLAGLAGYLAPALNETRTYAEVNDDWAQVQQSIDGTQGKNVDVLMALAAHRGGGRVYAGLVNNWGSTFYVGGVHVSNYVETTRVATLGPAGSLTFSLMSNPEANFDQDNPGDYSAFAVHYILAPSMIRPDFHATRIARRGSYSLWSVGTGGYVQVIDTRGAIAANATDLGKQTRTFLRGHEIGAGVFPTIAFDGHAAAAATLPNGPVPTTRPGRVLTTQLDLAHGRAVATVHASRTSVVLLKVSYDPGWSATVDGVRVPTEMVAPAMLGVRVSPGTHRVVFTYHGYGSYPLLFLIGLATLLGVAVVPMWSRRRRKPAGPAAAPEATATA